MTSREVTPVLQQTWTNNHPGCFLSGSISCPSDAQNSVFLLAGDVTGIGQGYYPGVFRYHPAINKFAYCMPI